MSDTIPFIYTERMLSNGIDAIAEKQVISGTPPEGFKQYRVGLQRPTGLADANGQPLMAAGEAQFDAASPEEAFVKLADIKAEFESGVKKQVAHAVLSAPPPKGFNPKKQQNGFSPRIVT